MRPGRNLTYSVCANPPGKPSSETSLWCNAITDNSHDEKNSIEDNGVCNWLEKLQSHGPVTLTPFDKQLWESLLDCNDTQRNGNNNRWRPTSEELIPSSTPTDCLLTSMPLQEMLEQNQLRTERGQSLSPPATPGAFRVVNWAAEPSDQRWNNYGAFRTRPLKPKSSRHRPKVLPKRITPRGVGAPGYIGRLKAQHHRQPHGVSGIEMFLSSFMDSPQNDAGGEGCVDLAKFVCVPSCLSRHRFVPNSLVPPSHHKKQQYWLPTDQLTDSQVFKQLDIRNPISTGLYDAPVSHCKIRASKTPWQPVNQKCSLPPIPRSSELTMEFSGDSSSSSNEHDDEEIDTEQVDEATVQKFRDSPKGYIHQTRPLNSELLKTRRNVIISVSGEQRRPVSFKSASTNTKRSTSTLVCGVWEETQSNDVLERLPAGLKLNGALPHDIKQCSDEYYSEDFNKTTGELYGSAPVLLHQTHAPLLAAKLPQCHALTARMLLASLDSFITPVWLSGNVEIGVVSAATMRQCLPDSNHFVWQRMRPARCSRTCCNFLSGPVDNSQSSEICLALHRCPVYIHYSGTQRASTAIVATDCQLLAVGVGLASLEITTALRYIGPSDVADASFDSPNLLAHTQSPPPIALCWPQPQITFLQWSRIPGELEGAKVVPPPARSLLFHAAPNGTEPLNNWSYTSRRQASRKGDQLRELRRIVRLRMRRKVRDNEFISVPELQCCCKCSSPSLTASAATPFSKTDEPKHRKQSIEGGTSQILLANVPEEIAASGLLDSRRSCRQTTTAAPSEVAAAQQQHPKQLGSVTAEQLSCLVELVQRVLHESFSQQAMSNSLLTALRGSGSAIGYKLGLEMTVVERSKEVEASAHTVTTVSPSNPSSSSVSDSSTTEDQFYSIIGTAQDAEAKATGSTVDQFYSPAAATNNNAEDAKSDAGTMASAVGGRIRHRTYYACKRIVRLEKSAAILVQETTCPASSMVAAVPIQLDGESSASCTSIKGHRHKDFAAKKRFNADRIRLLESKTLMQAWRRKPPVEPRVLERLEPTMSSFVWWSLLPVHNRVALKVNPKSISPSKSQTLQSSLPLQASSLSYPSHPVQQLSPTQPSYLPEKLTPLQQRTPVQSGKASGADSITADHCRQVSCELEMLNQLSTSSTYPSSSDNSAAEFDHSLVALSVLTFGK